MQWWAELSFSRWIRPYLRMNQVVRLLTHYIGLYDLAENEVVFAVLAICSKIHSMFNVFMI